MTLWDLIISLVRRWPIVVLGALLTCVIGLVAIDDRGVYWTRVEVLFLAPTSRLYPNSLTTTSEDLIITAGLVGKLITGPGKVTKYASADATLVGMGVRDGWSIRLPDSGGQWAANFASQTLMVEVVGPNREQVEATQQQLVAKIAETLNQMQREAGVAPVNDITTTITPESSVIYHIGGNRVRALAMSGLLGATVTISVVVLLDARTRSRRGRSLPAPWRAAESQRSRLNALERRLRASRSPR